MYSCVHAHVTQIHPKGSFVATDKRGRLKWFGEEGGQKAGVDLCVYLKDQTRQDVNRHSIDGRHSVKLQEGRRCLDVSWMMGRQISMELTCKATQTERHMSKTVQAETDKRGQSKQVVGGCTTNTVRCNRGWWTDEGSCTAFSVIPLSSAINQGSVLHSPLLHCAHHHAGKRVSARVPRGIWWKLQSRSHHRCDAVGPRVILANEHSRCCRMIEEGSEFMCLHKQVRFVLHIVCEYCLVCVKLMYRTKLPLSEHCLFCSVCQLLIAAISRSNTLPSLGLSVFFPTSALLWPLILVHCIYFNLK